MVHLRRLRARFALITGLLVVLVLGGAAVYVGETDVMVSRPWWAIAGVAAGVAAMLVLAVWLITGWMMRSVVLSQRFQRDFLADAAHELRTPLAVIQASVSHVLSRPKEAADYVSALTEIRAAVERASTGVLQLLDLSRLETGSVELVRAPLRLDLLVEEVVASAVAAGAPVELHSATPAVVDADYALLRHALDNVLRNAVDRANRVSVTVTTRDREALITVTDDGPGFHPNLLPHIFRRFTRGDARGHGIGLALVRSVLVLHGGRAEAANRPEGGADVRLLVLLSDAP